MPLVQTGTPRYDGPSPVPMRGIDVPGRRHAHGAGLVRTGAPARRAARMYRRAPMAQTTATLLLPMFRDAVEMLSLTRASFRHYDPGQVEMAMVLGRSIHKQERDLTEQLLADPPAIDGLRFVPSHVERISDAAQGLLRCLRTRE